MLGDEFAEAETFVQLAHQDEAPIRRDTRSLEIDLQRSVERKLEWLIFPLTDWVLTSRASSSHWNPHEQKRRSIKRLSVTTQKGNAGSIPGTITAWTICLGGK
jgi:hypothetical protein